MASNVYRANGLIPTSLHNVLAHLEDDDTRLTMNTLFPMQHIKAADYEARNRRGQRAGTDEVLLGLVCRGSGDTDCAYYRVDACRLQGF